MSDEIAKQEGRALFKADEGGALRPTNLSEAMELSKMLANSDFVPNDYRGKPGNVLSALQMGAEVGLAPMQSLQNIAVINGRPSIWGDAALALCRVHPQWGGIEETQDDGVATCRVTRIERGKAHITERTFSLEDAKRAGLAGKKGPWQEYPKRMCQFRARGFALRDAFPDALKGLHLAEESRDIIDVTASSPSDPATQAAPKRGAAGLRGKMEQRKKREQDEHAVPEGAQKWIDALNAAPDTDELAAIDRDLGEVRDELSADAIVVIESARKAAAKRLGELGEE